MYSLTYKKVLYMAIYQVSRVRYISLTHLPLTDSDNYNFSIPPTTYKLPSCTSSNPGHPDMACATLRYQTMTISASHQ
jgi:hypothetical protein